jgi:TolB-like protein
VSLIAELKRRSVFKVAAAYLVVGWLVVQAASIAFPAFEASPALMRGFILLVLLGFPVALVLAWAFELTPEGVKVDTTGAGSKRIFTVAAVLVALALDWFLRGGYAGSPAPAAEAVSAQSIAVLPFVNMSEEKENEFFADGLSEEILNSLTQIQGLQVVGRTSSFQFKGQNLDLREVGAKLGVATVLEGSVRRSGDRARITAQLVRVADGFHLWSDTYDRTLDDSFAVQHEIAEKVAGAMHVILDDRQRARLREAGVKNVEAFIAFQKGIALSTQAHDSGRSDDLIGTLRLANVEFARAAALDPGFALAHFGLTDLYGHILMADGHEDERADAIEAVRRELALATQSARDPLLRAHIEIDRKLYSDDWRGLAAQYEIARTTPGCAQDGWFLVGTGLGPAAGILEKSAARIACDPLDFAEHRKAAEAALWLGQPERAIEIVAAAEAVGAGSTILSVTRAKALVILGRVDEARSVLEARDPNGPAVAGAQLLLDATQGMQPAALRAKADAYTRGGWFPERWTNVDLLVDAMTGDRAASNRRMAAIDARPGGPLRIAAALTDCMCGVPFDLDATPNFKARIAESGLTLPARPLFAIGAMKAAASAPKAGT